MAETPQGRRLTELHRLAQARLGALTMVQMAAVWPLLDPERLDETFATWLVAAQGVVATQRAQSATLAANYLTSYRAAETGERASVTALATVPQARAVATSLIVTGPVAIKSAMGRGKLRSAAAETAKATSAAAAMRHVLNGGRETIIDHVRHDKRARGWHRVTSGRACPFCASLTGVVFTGPADFRAHDHCSCSVEPVYLPAAV